ncbi:MAG: DPP IV N-terminal domain-containing protein [candidate division Zixibacteria bacterium]|nr:DPP IV N-terminal domain-containing protein [candidate division Zixibacteria bacterium]
MKITLFRIFILLVILISILSIFYFGKREVRPKLAEPFATIQRLLDKNQPDSAIKALRFNLTADSTNPTFYYLLGKANFQKGELHLARNYFIRSLQLNSDQKEIRSFLAQIDFDLAQTYWEKDKKEALFYLISVLKNTEDKDLLEKVGQLTGGAYKIEQLTGDIFRDDGPSFSPDGKKIIYHSDTSYYSEEYPLKKKIIKKSKLFILDLIENKRTCLTQGDYSESFGRFSPDGNKIIFQRENSLSLDSGGTLNPEQDLILKDLKTNREEQLTSDKGYEGLASFFPDGQSIAYVKDYSIYVMDLKSRKTKNIYSSGENILTELQVKSLLRPISPFYPNTSPDGKKIIFQAGFDKRKIYLMDLRNSKITCLTYGEEDELYPSFSPDGKKILFVLENELYLMDTNSKNRIKLTNDKTEKKNSTFSPDGKKILFCAKGQDQDDHYFEIYLLHLDESISKPALNDRLKRIAQSL